MEELGRDSALSGRGDAASGEDGLGDELSGRGWDASGVLSGRGEEPSASGCRGELSGCGAGFGLAASGSFVRDGSESGCGLVLSGALSGCGLVESGCGELSGCGAELSEAVESGAGVVSGCGADVSGVESGLGEGADGSLVDGSELDGSELDGSEADGVGVVLSALLLSGEVDGDGGGVPPSELLFAVGEFVPSAPLGSEVEPELESGPESELRGASKGLSE